MWKFNLETFLSYDFFKGTVIPGQCGSAGWNAVFAPNAADSIPGQGTHHVLCLISSWGMYQRPQIDVSLFPLLPLKI